MLSDSSLHLGTSTPAPTCNTLWVWATAWPGLGAYKHKQNPSQINNLTTTKVIIFLRCSFSLPQRNHHSTRCFTISAAGPPEQSWTGQPILGCFLGLWVLQVPSHRQGLCYEWQKPPGFLGFPEWCPGVWTMAWWLNKQKRPRQQLQGTPLKFCILILEQEVTSKTVVLSTRDLPLLKPIVVQETGWSLKTQLIQNSHLYCESGVMLLWIRSMDFWVWPRTHLTSHMQIAAYTST